MKQVTGNMWTYPADWIGVTTNGMIKKDGDCVMGRGCAYEARERFSRLANRLGSEIKQHGNVIHWFGDIKLFSFPVKHNWYEKADLVLIKQSAVQLEVAANSEPDSIFLLPRPGCSNGRLKWEDVEPVINFLPDNVHVITKG